MSTSPQLQLTPSAFTVTIDGVTIEVTTWEKAISLLSQQATIRRQPITFRVTGTQADTPAFSLTSTGEISRLTGKPPARASVQLSNWNISRLNGPTLITFPTQQAATHHIQLVADIAKAHIPILITGYYTTHEEHNFTPAGANTGSLPALSQEDLESSLLATEPGPDTGPHQEVEPSHLMPLPHQEEAAIETVPAGTQPPAPQPHQPTDKLAYLFEETEHTKPHKTPLWNRLTQARTSIPTPAILEPRRNKIIAATAATTLLLAISGITSIIVAKTEPTPTAGISDTVLSTPAGYSDQPIWSLTLPDGAFVKATATATALITDETLSLYDSSNGEKIRDIPLTSPIDTLGEANIDGQPALIWRTGATLYAWSSSAGNQGKLITADLDPGTTLSGTGQEVLALTPNSAAILTGKGLQPYTVPADFTAIAATDKGIIAGNFTPTVLTITPEGATEAETQLTAPHPEQHLHSWKHANQNITATIWAENPEAICDPKDTSGCDEEVTLALHHLTDGTITSSYDLTLEDVAALPWVEGEGGQYGALGSYVFDETTGQQVTVLPQGMTVEKIKGRFSLTTGKDGAPLVFHSTHDGYQLSSVLLAQTDSATIIQQGDRVVAYPLALQ